MQTVRLYKIRLLGFDAGVYFVGEGIAGNVVMTQHAEKAAMMLEDTAKHYADVLFKSKTRWRRIEIVKASRLVINTK
jgi:hypothetical protein